MNEVKVQLNGKTFVLNFGMKVLRLLSEKWQFPGLNDVFKKISVFDGISDNLTFEQIDIINDIILCSIKANKDNTETLSSEELDELYLSDTSGFMKQVEIVFEGFTASMPQEKPGKQKAAKIQK